MTEPQQQEDNDIRTSAAAQVEALREANARSNETLMRLVEKVREDAHMREKKVELLEAGLQQTRRVMYLVAATFLVLMVMAVINTVNIGAARRNAAITAATAKDAKETYELLYGCFDPAGACAKSSAANQRKALDEIKKYELTALYCLRINPGTADPEGSEFIACLNRLYPGGPQLDKR